MHLYAVQLNYKYWHTKSKYQNDLIDIIVYKTWVLNFRKVNVCLWQCLIKIYKFFRNKMKF